MHRRAKTHAVGREEGRRLAKLPEIGITSTEIQSEIRQITGVHRQPKLARKTKIVDHVRQTHIIDPQFEGVVGHDRRHTARNAVDTNEANSQLLHTGQIGRRHTRVGAVHDVPVLTDGVPSHGDTTRQTGSLDHFEIGTGARKRILGRCEEIIFQLRTQNLKLRQIDTHLRQPRRLRRPGFNAGAIHVEVVFVASDLHIPVQFAILPPTVAATSHPQAQRSVPHERFGSLGEAVVCLGAIERTERQPRNAGLQT